MNDMPNDINPNQGKSKNKLLIFGGIGCFLILLLCVGGFGILGYVGSGVMKDVVQEMAGIENSLMNSDEVIEAIGSPVTVTPNPRQSTSQVDGVNYMVFTGDISGPEGKGTYEAKFIVVGMEGIELQSLTADVDGKLIEVDSDAELDLGIELGTESVE